MQNSYRYHLTPKALLLAQHNEVVALASPDPLFFLTAKSSIK